MEVEPSRPIIMVSMRFVMVLSMFCRAIGTAIMRALRKNT